MNTFISISLIIIFMLIAITNYLNHYQKKILNLITYTAESMPEKALEILDKKKVKILLSKKARLMLKLAPIIKLSDKQQLKQTVEELENIKLNDFNKIGIYQKIIEYYAMQEDVINSELYYSRLTKILRKEEFYNDKKYRSILSEAEMLIEVYVRKNIKFLPELINIANSIQDRAYKSVYYYRAAKLCFHNEQINEMRKYCNLSIGFCKGSKLEKKLKNILNNNFEEFNSF